MEHYDEMECGCFWSKDPDWGDVLTQCEGHKNKTLPPYKGSEPMTDDELAKFVKLLQDGLREYYGIV